MIGKLMEIGGHTRVYAVLGHPVGHTLSPAMHNAAFRQLGLDAVYVAFDVAPDRLAEVLPALAALGCGGVNLTVPLKEAAYRRLERLDESARLLGAVNTVQFADGRLIGHNTDGYGFLKAVEEAFGPCIPGQTVFVLGSGGAGRAVALVAAQAGARALTLADIEPIRSQKLAGEIRDRFPGVRVKVLVEPAEWAPAARQADLVVQATPLGMKPTDAAPLEPAAFRAGQRAFDLVYMYPETVFMRAARAGGAEAVNGLGMLLHQGARAFQIWTGRAPALDAMRAALEQKVYS